MSSLTFKSAALLIAVVLPACGDDVATESVDAATATSLAVAPSTATTLIVEDDAPAPGEEWLVYQEQLDGLQQIVLVRPDGTGRHQLAPGAASGHQTNPDWSPDGQQIVFAAGNGSTEDLWVIDADGRNASVLLECVDPCVALDDPAWSPDGGSVLFSRLAIEPGASMGTGSLELVDVDTGEVSVLLTAPEKDLVAGQRFSPDGSKVVLEWVHTDGSAPFEAVTGVELAVIDLESSSPTMMSITDATLFAATADWSPDGSTIVYSALASPDDPVPNLFAIRPDGTGQTQVTSVEDGKRSAEQPDYSSDGNRVVFAGTIDVRGRLLMSVDLTTGEVSPAVGGAFMSGTHPRSRPVD